MGEGTTDLAGAGVVITGAGSGIGRGLARACAARGARVVVADIEADAVEQVAAELREGGATAHAQVCDVADRQQVEALASLASERLGGVHVLFNNAGVGGAGRLDQTSERAFDWTFAVNVAGVYHGAHVFIPLLRETAKAGGFAHIVNTASEHALGLPPRGELSIYTASKHAVLGMSDALRRDLKPVGVGVSILCPGSVRTNVWDAARNRQPRYGGPRHAPPELAKLLERGQDPDAVGELTVECVLRGEFFIITHPEIRGYVQARYDEILAALDAADARVGSATR